MLAGNGENATLQIFNVLLDQVLSVNLAVTAMVIGQRMGVAEVERTPEREASHRNWKSARIK
jgi:hypothetical protein